MTTELPTSNTVREATMRGRLKVFLGYGPGTGKSFRMLDEARRRKERGQDVVIGALPSQLPAGIEPLLNCLEITPTVDREGVPVIDVPAILRRHPQVCIIDGLAYDSPWGRHIHRWQDVDELLSAGINVVASVNLKYIEDQRAKVEKLTGEKVTETIPRDFLNTADEIVVVDAPTEGAPPELAELRQMALFLSADVIDAGLQRYLEEHEIEPEWRPHERFLVCLTPQSNPERMLASARQSAARFHCDVMAVYVKQPDLTSAQATELEAKLARARATGVRVDLLEGDDDPVATIMQYARSHGITQLFVGYGTKVDWKTRLRGSLISRLIRAAEGMDVRVFPQ